MDDGLTPVSEPCHTVPEAGEVREAMRALLASPAFAKAPRMSRLLSFLVEKKLAGMEHQINECAIALDVFCRDPRVYHPALDPIVRVQMGRLRARLAGCYAAPATPPRVQIAIPMGSYVPSFDQPSIVRQSFRYKSLQVARLRNLTSDQWGNSFVCGLDEELGARLFQSFGNAIELREAGLAGPSESASPAPPHRLEGSVRVEDQHVRASIRLVDTGAGSIAWLSKFDCRGRLGMSLQEKLAAAICMELERYLVVGAGGPLPSCGSSM